MSTQTAHPADVKKGAPEPPPPPHVLAKCPNCGELVFFDELQPYVPLEFPKLLYKEKPKDAKPTDAEPPEIETVVVQNAEEEKKKEGEGWSKDVPQPKKAGDPAHKATEPPHPQGKPDEKKK